LYLYSFIKLNLKVVALTDSLICFLRHLTAEKNYASSDVSVKMLLNVRIDKFGSMEL